MRLKTEGKRRSILEAAKGVFLERGYDGTSMAELSARVGGSKQTLYSYFPSKEELLVAVVLEASVEFFDPVFEDFAASQDLPRALRDLAVGFLQLFCKEEIVAYRRIIIAEGAKSNIGRLAFENGPKRGHAMLAETFRRAMDDNRMRRADTTTAVEHFFGLCTSGPAEHLLGGVVDSVSRELIVEKAEAAADVFIRAYEVR